MESVEDTVGLPSTALKLCPMHKGCEFTKSITRLYVRCRIHYYFKFESRQLVAGKPKKKSQKAQILKSTSELPCVYMYTSEQGRGTPCPCLKLRCAEGREFEHRPGQYSRTSFSFVQVTGTVFPHLNMPFLPNSEFI